MNLDTLLTTTHVLAGAAFGVTVILMQTVVSPAMAKIPAGEAKGLAAAIIQARARLAVDVIIIVQAITALYLLGARWELIGSSPWLMAKVTLGVIALFMASMLHFYWRARKARLKAAGKDAELAALSAWTLKMEKVVLMTAPGAWFMGVIWGHM